MRVDGKHQILHRSLEFHSGNGFGNDLRGHWTDDMNAQNFAKLRIRYHFDKAFMVVHDAGLGIGREWEFADFYLVSGFFGFSFRQSYAANLRLAIGAAGDMVFVDRLRWLSGHAGNCNNAAHAGYMRKLRQPGNDVSNGVDALFTSLHPFVHMNIAALGLDVGGLLQADFFRVRPAANGHQHLLRFQTLLALSLWSKAHRHAAFDLFNFVHLGIDKAVDSFFLE